MDHRLLEKKIKEKKIYPLIIISHIIEVEKSAVGNEVNFFVAIVNLRCNPNINSELIQILLLCRISQGNKYQS